jgi:hypothetical protein
MSLEAMTWAFKQALAPAAKVVLLALADYADDEWRAWPSMKTMADKTSLSERAVRNNIRGLEDVGLISTEVRSRTNGSQTSNEYTLHGMPTPPAPSAGAPSPGATPPEPPSNPQENTPPSPSSEDLWFEDAWRAWPRKDGKKAARKAWHAATIQHAKDWEINAVHGVIDVAPLEPRERDLGLAKTVERFALAYQRHTPPRFIPHLSSWLNGERWNEPPPTGEDRGARQPEPPRPPTTAVPFGHRVVRDQITGHVIGTEPIS